MKIFTNKGLSDYLNWHQNKITIHVLSLLGYNEMEIDYFLKNGRMRHNE